jgi:hypothetical protein
MSYETEIRGCIRSVLIACIALFASSQAASAQRTMKGQLHIGAQASLSADPRVPIGGELSFGSYLLDSHISGWINVTPDYISLPTGHQLGYIPINVGADYMHRVAATRARSVNLYVGGGVFLGWELYDPFKRVPSYIDTGFGKGNFIYGVAPALESEFFITRTVALTLGTRMPVSISSKTEILKLHLKAGLRVNI